VSWQLIGIARIFAYQPRLNNSWREIVQNVRQEQAGRTHLKVVIYPCALCHLSSRETTGADAPLTTEKQNTS
jgi:hypothetical protein